MSAHGPSTRRDQRYELPRGTSFVEFQNPLSESQGANAELVRISVAGLALETSGPSMLRTGAIVKGVRVRVGECRIEGDLVVRSIEPAKDPALEVGCLFYPSGDRNAERLMALIAGIDAARAGL